jgi:hypothetical protein
MWAHTVSTSRLNGLLVANPKFPPSALFDDLTLISTRSGALHVKSATSAGHKVCVRRLEQTDKAYLASCPRLPGDIQTVLISSQYRPEGTRAHKLCAPI